MVELSLFAFRGQNAVLNRLEARIKLASLAGISMAALSAGPASLLLGLFAGTVVLSKAKIGFVTFVREIRLFMLLLACVVLSRGLTMPGPALLPEPLDFISRPGLAAGLLIACRLLLISMLGLSLTGTTRPSEIRAAVEWFLRPVPGIPHQKVATMIGLMIRFIPVIFTQSGDIAEAQRARALYNRKNPLYRIRCHCMPLLRRTFVTADRLAMAMQARCYSGAPTQTLRPTTGRDWLALGLAGVLGLLMLID